jgi:acyl-CoA synthetase (AMP-forming)/AMP-acid ligase II
LFVTISPGAKATPESLRHHLAGRLAPFKVPRTIRILEALPVMGSGKLDVAALRALVSVPDPPGQGAATPTRD